MFSSLLQMKSQELSSKQQNAIAAGCLALQLETKIASCSVQNNENDIEEEDGIVY